MFGCLVNVPCGSCRCRAGGDFSLNRRGHPLIHGTQCLVVFRASAYFRGLSICRVAGVCPATVLVLFLRFAICALFGIVVIRAGGAVDRHPDLLVPPVLIVMVDLDDPAVRWLPPGRATSRCGCRRTSGTSAPISPSSCSARSS